MRNLYALLPVLAAAWPAASRVSADDPKWRVQPNEVLVVFDDTSRDADGNGKGDSRDVAEYYATRRGIPVEDLLPLDLKGPKGETLGGDYPDFYERILTPVAEKLQARAADGTPFKDRIVYLVVCYGLPVALETHHDGKAGEHPVRPGQPVPWNAGRRSLDQWLIDVEANFEADFDRVTGKPGRPGGALGAQPADIRHPELFGLYTQAGRAKHFKELKRTQPQRFPYYLVARLGTSPEVAATQVDGAIYAERYLRLPQAQAVTTTSLAAVSRPAPAAWRPRIVLDHQPGFAADHVAALARLAAILQGAGPVPLFSNERSGLLRPWPLTVDNQRPEIGEPLKDGPLHPPTLTARIEADGVDPAGRLVRLTGEPLGRSTLPSAPYWSPGLAIASSSGGRAEVVGLDFARNALQLTTVERFRPGDTISWAWPGEFPISDCFFYYGFYGLGKRWDCYQFLPGAIGIHVDSSCMNWAQQQLTRGLSVAFGVVNEPFSAGIPYMDSAWVGIATGHDACESLYAGLALNTRWAGVLFADPLYAPFRSLGLEDTTAPALREVSARAGRAGELVVRAELADGTPDERGDIALFRIDYGTTPARTETVPFVDWPEPGKSQPVPGRRYQYARRFQHTLTGLKPDTVYYLRIIARDPAGNVSAPATLAARAEK